MAAERVFAVLPGRRRAKAVQLAVYAGFGALALALAVVGPWGWIGWLTGGLLLGLALGKALSLARMRYVVKLDASGVTACMPTGREMQASWSEIEAHTIDPQKGLGGLVLGSGRSGRVRIMPIATRDMGEEAATDFLAALKEQLPKLEYRVPTLGKR